MKTGGLHLLVAEATPTNQIVARRMLEKLGYSVDVADDGCEALAQLARRVYSAVLIECQLPELDGYELARRIRSGAVPGVGADTPIIAVTACVQARDRLQCLQAGMNDHVAKPVRISDLDEALRRCGLNG